jgi:hypothetical protein
MTPRYPIPDSGARSSSRAPGIHFHEVKRPARGQSARTGALCALLALASSVLVAPTGASAAPPNVGPFAPGSVVVSQGGSSNLFEPTEQHFYGYGHEYGGLTVPA